MDLKVVELFAGVGGFRVGLNNIKDFNKETGLAIENNNWDFVWANQYEPQYKGQDAYNCYTTRFGNKDVSNEDITKVDKNIIPEHSLLVGGFPCQDYSVARSLKDEQGIKGKKGVLFWDIRDTLIAKKTPFVLLENVDRILKSPLKQRGRDFAIILKTFDELGYYVFWRVINAAEYTMPQKRKRTFIFAVRKDTKYANKIINNNIKFDNILNKNFPCKINEINKFTLNDYKDILDTSDTYNNGKFLETGYMINGNIETAKLKEISQPIYPLKDIIKKANNYNNNINNYIVKKDKLDKWKYLKSSKRIERINKQGKSYIYSEGEMSFPENLNKPARTLLTSEGSINRSSHIIYDENINDYRILTEIECELIQMFPINWTDTMKSRKRYFVMGNALVTGIINKLEPDLKKIIKEE